MRAYALVNNHVATVHVEAYQRARGLQRSLILARAVQYITR